jgi:hypothetical protein
MFWNRSRDTVFTGKEVTALIMLASVIDLETFDGPIDDQIRAVIYKTKNHCVHTPYPNGKGVHIYCPPIEIAR